MSTVPLDRRAKSQKIGQLAGDAELGSLALDIFDELEDGIAGADTLSNLQLYQLGLLASFFESARRGALDDVQQLAVAHQAAATATADRPLARPPTLDDDEHRWALVMELNGEDEKASKRLLEKSLEHIDDVRAGNQGVLQTDFAQHELVPFLDGLAHLDSKMAEAEVEGYHSLHG